MSYALELTEPAINDLRQLENWLQEDALDEIELMLVKPPSRRRRVGDFVYDFVRQKGQDTYYVFITIYMDEQTHSIRVKSIAQHLRPRSPH